MDDSGGDVIGSRRFDCRLLFDGRDVVGVVVEGFGIVVWVLVACFFNIFCSLFPSYYDVWYDVSPCVSSSLPAKRLAICISTPDAIGGTGNRVFPSFRGKTKKMTHRRRQQPAERHGTAMSPSICFALSYDISTNIIFRYYQSSSDR